MTTQKRTILAIVGETGSGKSELAQQVARLAGASLVSVDSRKVYRGMDIGTAKPSREAIREFDYAMIDCADPSEYFSAGRFAREARAIVGERLARGQNVILVGGTGFYLDAFMRGLAESPDVTAEVREGFESDIQRVGWEGLYAELASRDPEFAGTIHAHDKTRIRRGLEICRQTGSSMKAHLSTHKLDPVPWPIVVVWPATARENLRIRIENRVSRMRGLGLTNEVANLLANGLTQSAPGLATVGYRELAGFLGGSLAEDEAYERIVINTRRYAKRQTTWFRHRDYVRELDAQSLTPQSLTSIWRGDSC